MGYPLAASCSPQTAMAVAAQTMSCPSVAACSSTTATVTVVTGMMGGPLAASHSISHSMTAATATVVAAWMMSCPLSLGCSFFLLDYNGNRDGGKENDGLSLGCCLLGNKGNAKSGGGNKDNWAVPWLLFGQ